MTAQISGVSAYDVIVEKITELSADPWRSSYDEEDSARLHSIEALCDVLKRLSPHMSEADKESVARGFSDIRVPDEVSEVIQDAIAHLRR